MTPPFRGVFFCVPLFLPALRQRSTRRGAGELKSLSNPVDISNLVSYYVNKFSAGFDSVLLFESVSYGIFTTTDR